VGVACLSLEAEEALSNRLKREGSLLKTCWM